jgi:hypothetical protein
MSKRSEAVKKWRSKTKDRMVEAFGGECGICGYNKSNHALSFHHLDPTEKEFSIASIRRNPKNWLYIVEELKKCICVCNNCHSEIHDGITEIPKTIKRFDERYIEYEKRVIT